MIFFATPFKQLATGLEKFRPLLYMSVCSNVVRSLALILLSSVHQLSMDVIIIIFIAGDLAELLLCFLITKTIIKVPVVLRWDKKEYKGLLRESLPQLGVAVFTSVIARFDWIFLGLYTTSVILANYSFAYKIFEVATLPLIVVAPVLIPRFTKIFHPLANESLTEKTNDLFILLRIEMVIASFVALALNILWIPVIDFITDGKYGAVNACSILLLSATMPFLYLNNFLWTINFARGLLKMIFFVFLVTFLVNIIADIILIHFFKADGAAAAYLLTIISQSALYIVQTKMGVLKRSRLAVLACPAIAILCGFSANSLFHNCWLQLLVATFFFAVLLVITRQLRLSDWPVIKRVTRF
jgi:O-antigen/teichoic acid export membrane protein